MGKSTTLPLTLSGSTRRHFWVLHPIVVPHFFMSSKKPARLLEALSQRRNPKMQKRCGHLLRARCMGSQLHWNWRSLSISPSLASRSPLLTVAWKPSNAKHPDRRFAHGGSGLLSLQSSLPSVLGYFLDLQRVRGQPIRPIRNHGLLPFQRNYPLSSLHYLPRRVIHPHNQSHP